jgi:hypothetical protein
MPDGNDICLAAVSTTSCNVLSAARSNELQLPRKVGFIAVLQRRKSTFSADAHHLTEIRFE